MFETNAHAVAALYLAYFDRPAEPDGLAYWTARLDAGESFFDVARSFAATAEARSLYPDLRGETVSNPHGFIHKIFGNIFGRDASATDVGYWYAAIEGGTPAWQVLAEMVLSAQGSDAAKVQNTLDVSLYASYAIGEAGIDFIIKEVRPLIDDVGFSYERIMDAKSDIDAYINQMLTPPTGGGSQQPPPPPPPPQGIEDGKYLLVSDSGSDIGIATLLSSHGGDVTILTGGYTDAGAISTNTNLLGDLSEYDAVFWSQSGSGSGGVVTDASLFANLENYVNAGGYVYVTGYDSIAGPSDPDLIAFLGGTGAKDFPTVTDDVTISTLTPTPLTIGYKDIGGLDPLGFYVDMDGIILGPGSLAIGVAAIDGQDSYVWSILEKGSGAIAYVSNGAGNAHDHPSWTNEADDGYGAYSASVLNFAYNALNGFDWLL